MLLFVLSALPQLITASSECLRLCVIALSLSHMTCTAQVIGSKASVPRYALILVQQQSRQILRVSSHTPASLSDQTLYPRISGLPEHPRSQQAADAGPRAFICRAGSRRWELDCGFCCFQWMTSLFHPVPWLWPLLNFTV